MSYTTHISPRRDRRQIEQTQAIPGKDQVQNSAGGFVFAINDWDRLDRFLVLGAEGGSYYASERQLTIDNAEAVKRCIDENGTRVVNRIVEISEGGRAVKNDPALFVLAMCAAADGVDTRRAAFDALPKVARIGTHLFNFTQFMTAFRGWSRMSRRGVANWYTGKSLNDLIYQVMKYKQRNGWSHQDLIRLSHPKTQTEEHSDLFKYLTKPETVGLKDLPNQHVFKRLEVANILSTETDAIKAVNLITEFNMPRETLNTGLLNSKEVWSALLQRMPLTAMVRNLGKMTAVGALEPMSDYTKLVTDRLRDATLLRKARVHPLTLFAALHVYSQGKGVRGKLTWTPIQSIVDALNDAVYLAFDNVEGTNKRLYLALDVSGSMSWPASQIAGLSGITARDASAVMAMVTASVESQYLVKGFSAANRFWDGNIQMNDIRISPRMRLDSCIQAIRQIPMGGTDCAMPMLDAAQKNIPVDAFIVYTDNETYAGNIHPCQALEQYRQKTGIAAKLIVVGMVSNEISIADPNDAGMMDVVGFDTAAPNVISEFIMK